MDDKEAQQLQDIADEVKGSHVQLGAIDERTRNIERQITDLSESADKNQNDIDNLQGKVKRNTTIISGITAGASLSLLWVIEQLGASL